ncbi:hypothetical protein BSL78_09206 [Apostichopus japonicus]|uniref:Tumor protein p53-inducible nuclear protein 1 n=1 Tax=Stichopus japonicus TaxID=307972 RepID=A0A2G8L0V6_STIJA|nr:hypothetical protein BSL78_09206 [Apostichopus japonicus]
MLSSLSEYFFGAVTPTAEEQPEKQHPESRTKEEESRKLAEPMEVQEDEDDWVLVDVTNEDRVPPCPTECRIRGKFSNKGLEESWFVTPHPVLLPVVTHTNI